MFTAIEPFLSCHRRPPPLAERLLEELRHLRQRRLHRGRHVGALPQGVLRQPIEPHRGRHGRSRALRAQRSEDLQGEVARERASMASLASRPAFKGR